MSPRPNLVVFMSDDHAQWASSPYGNSELNTPGLARLAATGTLFQNAYTPSPVCSPARACFFTGRYPSQHGVHDWIDRSVADRAWLSHERTLAEVLSAEGYQTGLVGKWHLGRDSERQPGFDTWFCYERGQYPHLGEVRFSDSGRSVTHSGSNTEALTLRACRFLRERDRSRPFFLFVGPVATHSPFRDQPERLVAKYRTASFRDCPRETWPAPQGWIKFGLPADPAILRETLAQYYAAVESIDELVRAVLAELESDGALADTLVVYTSDHGHMNGQHGLLTKGNATVPVNFYEESIRIPCLLSWPGKLPEGSRLTTPVNHCDLFRTLVDYAGSGMPSATLATSGEPMSFRPLLEGDRSEDEARPVICEYGNSRMIRRGSLKYIQRLPIRGQSFGDECYDLATDPRERHNRVADAAYRQAVLDGRHALETFFAVHSEDAFSGARILDQPLANATEPWRLLPPEAPSNEGTDLKLLFSYGRRGDAPAPCPRSAETS